MERPSLVVDRWSATSWIAVEVSLATSANGLILTIADLQANATISLGLILSVS